MMQIEPIIIIDAVYTGCIMVRRSTSDVLHIRSHKCTSNTKCAAETAHHDYWFICHQHFR